jgi:hypothetical protein
MDAQEQLVFGGEISVAVLGKGADFVLIELQGEIDEDATEDAREKGYTYCGVLGVKDGQAGAKCEPHPDAVYTMLHAGLAFAQLVADRLKPPPKGDGVEWLTALFALEDSRNTEKEN